VNLEEARDVLGLSEKDGVDEAKKKFRTLSKKYHPDVSEDPDAETKFKRINEAYDYIKSGKADKPNFQNFENGGPSWSGFGFSSNPFGSNPFNSTNHIRIEHIQKDITISFKESVWGTKKNLTFRRKIKCEDCKGNGSIRLNNGCDKCGGIGMINSIRGNMMISQTCPQCLGNIKNQACPSCNGNGYKDGTTSLEINIPAGIMNGNVLRLQGMGNFAGRMMGMDQASDVHVVVSVLPEEGLSIEGKDVISHLNISLLEALKGTKKKVKTIDGIRDIDIKSKTKHKDNIIIPKLGVAKVGSHRVILDIEYPSDIDGIIQILEKDK